MIDQFMWFGILITNLLGVEIGSPESSLENDESASNDWSLNMHKVVCILIRFDFWEGGEIERCFFSHLLNTTRAGARQKLAASTEEQ